MAVVSEVRRVLWRTLGVAASSSLLPKLQVTFNDGLVRVTDEDDPEVLAFVAAGGTIGGYSPTDAALLVDAERDRRIASGIEYPTGSGRIIQTRDVDQTNISQQMLRAVALLALGTPEAWGTGRSWLDASNANPLPLPDPQAMIELGIAVGDRKEALIYRGYELKARLRAGEDVNFAADAAWQ